MWKDNDEPLCSTEELKRIMGNFEYPTDPYNEVYPNVYIGTGGLAMNIDALENLGITHVLNAACGKGKFYFVKTSAEYYEPYNIKFMGVPAIDVTSFQMEPHFQQAADFIDEAIKMGGKVMVHCLQGISRSATLVLAYLMIKKGMSIQDAIKAVRAKRKVMPNDGFLRQLCDLNEKVHRVKM